MNIPYYTKVKTVSGLEPVQTKGKGCQQVKKPVKYKKHQALKF